MKLDEIQDRAVDSGDAVRFICGLRRGDSVEFSWTRNGTVLSNDGSVKIVNDVDSSVLTIRKSSVADVGRYTCIAKNAVSEARENAFLNVKGDFMEISRLQKIPPDTNSRKERGFHF